MCDEKTLPFSRPGAPNVRTHASRGRQTAYTAHVDQPKQAEAPPRPLPPAEDPAAAPQAEPGAPAVPGPLGALFHSPYDDSIARVAAPALLALAADPLLSLVDTAFAGHLGTDALAAVGVNSAFGLILVFNCLGTTITPLVAAAMAEGRPERAARAVWQAGAVALALGVAISASLLHWSADVLQSLGANPADAATFAMAEDFFRWRALSAPAVLLAIVGQGAFRGVADMKTPLRIVLFTNALNLAGDYLFLVHLNTGVSGAAVATTCAEWTAALAYLYYLTAGGGVSADTGKEGEAAAPRLSLWPPPPAPCGGDELAEMGALAAGGAAVLLRTSLLLGTKTAATVAATRLGPVPVAAHQVVTQLWTLSSLMCDSLAVSAQSLVAASLGQGDFGTARGISQRLMQLGVGLGAVMAGGLAFTSPVLPGLFTDDPATAAAISSILPIAILSLPVNCSAYVLDGIMVAAREYIFMAGAAAVAGAATLAALASAEEAGMGLQGVWVAMVTLMVCRAASLMWRALAPDSPLRDRPRADEE
ncbi:unnamed protein product [Pedinophyceae sp. YPF-701]|nr:unnamed protein product [Pedinophyceae sp. YPF-701]